MEEGWQAALEELFRLTKTPLPAKDQSQLVFQAVTKGERVMSLKQFEEAFWSDGSARHQNAPHSSAHAPHRAHASSYAQQQGHGDRSGMASRSGVASRASMAAATAMSRLSVSLSEDDRRGGESGGPHRGGTFGLGRPGSAQPVASVGVKQGVHAGGAHKHQHLLHPGPGRERGAGGCGGTGVPGSLLGAVRQVGAKASLIRQHSLALGGHSRVKRSQLVTAMQRSGLMLEPKQLQAVLDYVGQAAGSVDVDRLLQKCCA